VSKHNYVNPSEKQDLSHLEAGLSDGEMLDKNGFTVREPISDRECIYKCLHNSINLAGLDKKQVERLCKEFEVERTVEELQTEYPPL
jgi:aspartate/tyrosine/aromatic aminotransferase